MRAVRRLRAPALGVVTVAVAASTGARAAAGEEDRLSAAWPFGALVLHVGATVGAIHSTGRPLDDALARVAVGAVAGAAPAAAILALWGEPCGQGRGRAACWVEAATQAIVVAGVDLAAMYAAMRFVREPPYRAARPSVAETAIWSSAWIGATASAMALPPLFGGAWGEDFWSTAGLFAWLHAALATAMLAVVYATDGAPEHAWIVSLPIGAF